MTFGYVLGALVFAGLVWLANGVRQIGAISRGESIGNRQGTALLLIDLQSVFWDHGPYSEDSKLAARTAIFREVQAAKARKHPVIALRQEWSIPSTKLIARMTMKGHALEGSSGTELAEPFATLADQVLVKRVQDAFETKKLDTLLEDLDIGTLRIVGLDFNYCVQRTALAARNRGYKVTVIKSGSLSAGPSQHAEERMVSRGVELL